MTSDPVQTEARPGILTGDGDATAAQHGDEVARGERFQFGQNWTRFLSTLNDQKIALAETSLKSFLGVERLDGKSFVDIGSGSGLFSLAARRLGARVHSFDYDPDSFACTQELRRRYFDGDADWVVENASVLDSDYLSGLGQFDIVYSWGVLHHTGSMWQALDNIKPLARVGGELFIAIYNDQGKITDEWERIKATYNRLPKPLALAYALNIIRREEAAQFSAHLKHSSLGEWARQWREYDSISLRGMNKWHDWIDWIGGYPYERATVEAIVDFYAKDGFRIDKVADRSNGYGCNEFVFRRIADAGVLIDSPVPGGSSMARRHGRRLAPPEARGDQVVADFVNPAVFRRGSKLIALRGDRIVAEAALDGQSVVLTASSAADLIGANDLFVVAAERRTFKGPFKREAGHMWLRRESDLSTRADSMEDPVGSDVFIFQGGRQLPYAHVMHSQIAETGDGRFSHWGDFLHFAPLDNLDPNASGLDLELVMPARPLPARASFAQSHGAIIAGPFSRIGGFWTAPAPSDTSTEEGVELFLFRDDDLLGEVSKGAQHLQLAAADEDERILAESVFRLAPARRALPSSPISQADGLAWQFMLPEWTSFADNSENPNRSPLRIFDRGRPLPAPHAMHSDISTEGGGLYSHWNEAVWFSSLDGEEPLIGDLTLLLPS